MEVSSPRSPHALATPLHYPLAQFDGCTATLSFRRSFAFVTTFASFASFAPFGRGLGHSTRFRPDRRTHFARCPTIFDSFASVFAFASRSSGSFSSPASRDRPAPLDPPRPRRRGQPGRADVDQHLGIVSIFASSSCFARLRSLELGLSSSFARLHGRAPTREPPAVRHWSALDRADDAGCNVFLDPRSTLGPCLRLHRRRVGDRLVPLHLSAERARPLPRHRTHAAPRPPAPALAPSASPGIRETSGPRLAAPRSTERGERVLSICASASAIRARRDRAPATRRRPARRRRSLRPSRPRARGRRSRSACRSRSSGDARRRGRS